VANAISELDDGFCSRSGTSRGVEDKLKDRTLELGLAIEPSCSRF
jgi:hypothetical protein